MDNERPDPHTPKIFSKLVTKRLAKSLKKNNSEQLIQSTSVTNTSMLQSSMLFLGQRVVPARHSRSVVMGDCSATTTLQPECATTTQSRKNVVIFNFFTSTFFRVEVLDPATFKVLNQFEKPAATYLDISPKNNYLSVWQPHVCESSRAPEM